MEKSYIIVYFTPKIKWNQAKLTNKFPTISSISTSASAIHIYVHGLLFLSSDYNRYVASKWVFSGENYSQAQQLYLKSENLKIQRSRWLKS